MSRIIYICCICWKRNGTSSSRIRLFFSPVHPDIFLKIFLSRKIKMSVFWKIWDICHCWCIPISLLRLIMFWKVITVCWSILKNPPHFRMEILFYVLQTFSTHFRHKIKTASLLISFYVSQHLILFSFIYWIIIIIYPHCIPIWFTEILTAILSGTLRMTLH